MFFLFFKEIEKNLRYSSQVQGRAAIKSAEDDKVFYINKISMVTSWEGLN